MYGLWSQDQKTYSVYLDGDQTINISEQFLQAVRNLPPWKAGDPSVKSKYDAFFGNWGTHYIRECFLGTRYQLRVVKEGVSTEAKEKMSANIEAEYGGIVKASAKASYDSSEESANYMRSCDTKCYVRGGDPALAQKLEYSPKDQSKFGEWVDSRKEGATDAIVNVRLEDYGTLLRNCSNQSYQNLGQRLLDATDMVTLEATLTVKTKRWSPPNGEFSPVDARVWFSVSGPGISIKTISRQDCTLHEESPTGFVANQIVNPNALPTNNLFSNRELYIQLGINGDLSLIHI